MILARCLVFINVLSLMSKKKYVIMNGPLLTITIALFSVLIGPESSLQLKDMCKDRTYFAPLMEQFV